MVEVIDVSRGRGLRFPVSIHSQDLLHQSSLQVQSSSETLFLISAEGDLVENGEVATGTYFLLRKEEGILDDKEFLPVQDWRRFTAFPPGDWYTEAFDFDQLDQLPEALRLFPGSEKRLFKCQEEAKMMYATYKQALDLLNSLETVSKARAAAAVAIMKSAKKYVKEVKIAHENMRQEIPPLASDYKEKLKEMKSLPVLSPAQAKTVDFFLRNDFGKLYSETQLSVDQKMSKVQNLLLTLMETISKAKRGIKNKHQTVISFFTNSRSRDTLLYEPMLAVTLTSIRSEYTNLRDMFNKLLDWGLSVSARREIMQKLTSGFEEKTAEFEQELKRNGENVKTLGEILAGATTEHNRSRQALSQAMDSAATVISSLRIKFQMRVPKLKAKIEVLKKYTHLLELPGVLLKTQLETDLEKERRNSASIRLQQEFESLTDKVKLEENDRRRFYLQYGTLIPGELYSILRTKAHSAPSEAILSRSNSLFQRKQAELRIAYETLKASVRKEISILEGEIVTQAVQLHEGKEMTIRLEQDIKSFAQMRNFKADFRTSRYQTEVRKLADTQQDCLEEINRRMLA